MASTLMIVARRAPALTRDLSITYTGKLYEGQRDPTILFKVVRDLIEEEIIPADGLSIRFYGPIEPDPRETGHHSAKLFEYFAVARPVLAVGGSRGVLTQSLEETRAGVHAMSSAQVREFLLRSYGEFKRNGSVSYSGYRRAIERYSHPEITRSFAKILDSEDSNAKRTQVILQPNRNGSQQGQVKTSTPKLQRHIRVRRSSELERT